MTFFFKFSLRPFEVIELKKSVVSPKDSKNPKSIGFLNNLFWVNQDFWGGCGSGEVGPQKEGGNISNISFLNCLSLVS